MNFKKKGLTGDQRFNSHSNLSELSIPRKQQKISDTVLLEHLESGVSL